jgi:hypothetical protein
LSRPRSCPEPNISLHTVTDGPQLLGITVQPMDDIQQPLPKHLITYLINRTHHLDGSRFTVISH